MELRNKPKEGAAEDETKHMVIKDSILRQMLAAPLFTCKCPDDSPNKFS